MPFIDLIWVGSSLNILLILSGEGGWEFLILFVTSRPNEKQRNIVNIL